MESKIGLVVVLCSLMICVASGAPKEKDATRKLLEDVCANRNKPLGSVSEVRAMIKLLHNDPSLCTEKYRQSFRELDPILYLGKHRYCDDFKFNQIKNYHFRYINPPVEKYKFNDRLCQVKTEIKKRPLNADLFDNGVQVDEDDQEIMIPIALQLFFKAWALQVSGLCKRDLMDNLERAVQENMNKDDLRMIGPFFTAGKNLKDPITNKKIDNLSFESVLYMPELEGNTRPELDMIRDTVTKLDLKDRELNAFMHACKLRFKPIYSSLVLPVVRMAKLGYDYMGLKLMNAYGTIESNPEVLGWLGLTAVCEARGDFELVEVGEPIKMDAIEYSPRITSGLSNDLWIVGQVELQKELDRIKGSRSTGLKRVLYETGVTANKIVSFLDPHRSAWYRRNQNTLSSTLNTMSIISNLASISVTFIAG